jgi:hypothetical protein
MCISMVYLVNGYHQVPLVAADIPRTAIITPFGLFEYFSIAFGLKNVAQAFHCLVDQIFCHLPFVYLLTWTTTSLPARSWKSTWINSVSFSAFRKRTVCMIIPAKDTFAAAEVDFLDY